MIMFKPGTRLQLIIVEDSKVFYVNITGVPYFTVLNFLKYGMIASQRKKISLTWGYPMTQTYQWNVLRNQPNR